MNYILDRLREAGSYRSLIWMLIGGTQVANYVNEEQVGVLLAAASIVAGAISFLMKEKKDVTVTAQATAPGAVPVVTTVVKE
jgi:hypothetical protein